MSVLYKLKIELSGSDPRVWRRVTVPGSTTFDILHDIIQIAMGWNNEYEFTFDINGTIVYDFGPEVDLGDNPYERDALSASLDELVTMVGTRYQYIYGSWVHDIILEEIVPHAKGESEDIDCNAGEGSCPPDSCGCISRYQSMLVVLADEKHPDHDNIKRQFGEWDDISPFDIEEVNARLERYSGDWLDIYDEADEIIDRLEDEPYDERIAYSEKQDSEYERLKHLRSPSDVLNDVSQRHEMELWVNDALTNKNRVESKTFTRLVNRGAGEEESRAMILEAFAVEWFYDLKYGTDYLDARYESNLQRLPERPVEIPSVDCAVRVLGKCTKGVPVTAIEYLHDDTSLESRSAILKALRDYSDNQSLWADSYAAPIWYSFAAEGHLCEELIDPIIGFYTSNHENETDWISEQGQYLIGKLAQKYPDITVQKVLAALERDPEHNHEGALYYLFDVFDFCNIDTYKDRLLALLKRDAAYWHEVLATTISHLQIKEALPALKEQLRSLVEENPKKNLRDNGRSIELEEAIRQLESGEDLYPEVDTPLCLRRGTTWKEEVADAEENFYDSGPFPGNEFVTEWEHPGDVFYHQQPISKINKVGRNDPCPCGSGKKYKKCCLDKDL